LITGACAAAGGVATFLWPDFCLVQTLHYSVFVVLVSVLLVIGIPLWFMGGAAAMRAYSRDELVTSGVFGLVRHPIYSAWIVLILPGLALLSCSWPLLLMPIVAYAVFKKLIHREDEYLLKRFGREYLDYRARVNEIIPVPRFWRI
jgi:protein-S-isoprenylcysteine O-methyltransferase Ste14